MACFSWQAGATVGPSRFVSPQLNGIDYTVIHSDGTQNIVGITQLGTLIPPGTPGFDANIAAVSGGFVGVFADEDEDEVLLYLGATVTGGQLLISDTNAFGKPINTAASVAQYVGAQARESGVSGDLIRVIPRIDAVGRMA